MTQTFQSGFSSYLTSKLEAGDTTAYLATVPTVTKGRMFLTDGLNKERISFTGVSGSTITGLTRGLSQTADPATSGTGLSWIAGTQIKLVAMHDQMPDKQEATTFGDVLTVSDTSLAGIRLQSLTTAQMNAIASPVNGDMIYNSTAGENYQYIGGAWSAVSAGSTQANSSTTVAGKVETATSVEGLAGTVTGGTGANLVITPDVLAKIIQDGSWVYASSSTGSDTYTASLTPAPTAYSTGMLVVCKFTTANTGACTLNLNSLGAKNIKTQYGNDPQDGVISANSVHILQYDGTNMILHTPDFASTSNKGISEMATDAEAIARTDTSRYVNPSQLGLVTSVAILQGTRAADTASGNQTIAHGLSTTPKWIEVICMAKSSTGSTIYPSISQGWSNGSTDKCTYVGTLDNAGSENTSGNDNSKCIHMSIYGSAGESTQVANATFDGTNITLAWTYTADTTVSTETMYITILAHT